MSHSSEFEPGFDPVVTISAGSDRLGVVGFGRGMLRLEFDEDVAIQFDAEGRLISAHVRGRGYRRTLDNRLLVAEHAGQGERRRWTRGEEPVEPLSLLSEWHAQAARLEEALDAGATVQVTRGTLELPSSRLKDALARAGAWTDARLRSDTERLREIYLPIPILPPDQYTSIVLQATEGCSFNRCSFCNFYRSTSYRERSLHDFRAHLQAVVDHLGGSLTNYHRVFLGQANALLIDTGVLVEMLDIIQTRLPLRPFDLDGEARRRWRTERDIWIDGVYAFVDSFHDPKHVDELSRLRERGLRRVYLGLETGSLDLLRVLGKPGTPDAAVALAHNLHEAGLELGAIVLVGAGGKTKEQEHLRKTMSIIERMNLRRGDQVYLSKLVIYEGSPYQQRVWQRGLTPLTPFDLASQAEEFRVGLRSVVGAGVPVAPYDVDLSRSLFTP